MKNKHWIVAAALSVSLASGVLIKARAEDKEKEEGDEQKIKLTEAPAAVQEALKKESKGAKIETIDKEMRDGKQVFEADAIVDGKNHEIIVDGKGNLYTPQSGLAGGGALGKAQIYKWIFKGYTPTIK